MNCESVYFWNQANRLIVKLEIKWIMQKLYKIFYPKKKAPFYSNKCLDFM